MFSSLFPKLSTSLEQGRPHPLRVDSLLRLAIALGIRWPSGLATRNAPTLHHGLLELACSVLCLRRLRTASTAPMTSGRHSRRCPPPQPGRTGRTWPCVCRSTRSRAAGTTRAAAPGRADGYHTPSSSSSMTYAGSRTSTGVASYDVGNVLDLSSCQFAGRRAGRHGDGRVLDRMYPGSACTRLPRLP